MSRAKVSFIVMAITLVLVMTFFFWPQAKAPAVITTTIGPGVFERTHMLDGEAVSSQRQLIMAPVDGIISQTYARSGEWVTAGQLVAAMDVQAETAALSQLDLQWYEVTNALGQQGLQAMALTPVANLRQQKEALRAAIACKQLRVNAEGRVENLYITPGSYVKAGSVIAAVVGDGLQISGNWTLQDGQMPSPGMQAWWCTTNGTRVEPLLLESVGAPIPQNQGLVYPLVFRCLNGEKSRIQIGEKAPVCLVLEEKNVPAMLPCEALDRDQKIWVVRNGKTEAVDVLIDEQNDQQMQIQPELAGEQAILEPETLDLYEGMPLRQPLKTAEAQ